MLPCAGSLSDARTTSRSNQMVCSGYNKNGTCMVYVPITHNEPACYELILRAEGEEWGVCVDPTTYDTIPYESTFKAA